MCPLTQPLRTIPAHTGPRTDQDDTPDAWQSRLRAHKSSTWLALPVHPSSPGNVNTSSPLSRSLGGGHGRLLALKGPALKGSEHFPISLIDFFRRAERVAAHWIITSADDQATCQAASASTSQLLLPLNPSLKRTRSNLIRPTGMHSCRWVLQQSRDQAQDLADLGGAMLCCMHMSRNVPAACQVMMQRGWMAEEEAKAHFRQLTGREDGEHALFASDVAALRCDALRMRRATLPCKFLQQLPSATAEVMQCYAPTFRAALS